MNIFFLGQLFVWLCRQTEKMMNLNMNIYNTVYRDKICIHISLRSDHTMFFGFVQDHEDCNFCSMLRLTIAGLDTMTPAMSLAAPDTADGHSPNWTDVISIQAEWTRKNLITWHCIYCVLISPQLCFLPEELLYYKQSSSNEKFLARACFQDILCTLASPKLQRSSKSSFFVFSKYMYVNT